VVRAFIQRSIRSGGNYFMIMIMKKTSQFSVMTVQHSMDDEKQFNR
jgi:hypothetical protein